MSTSSSTLFPPPPPPPGTPIGSPGLTPVGTPGGPPSPRLSVRRSLSGLTRLFSAGASASDAEGSGGAAAPPVSMMTADDNRRPSVGGLQPSLIPSDAMLASSSSSGRQTPSGEPWLVMLPRVDQPTRHAGTARSGKPYSAGSPSTNAPGVNIKKLRVAGRLLEELETEALSANVHEEADQDYIAHILSLSLTSALASVPPDIQGRVFAQSPQLGLLPPPGFRFEYLGTEDPSWKERAADGLGKGLAALWVGGIPLLVHCITLLATVAGIVQAVLIRLRVKEIIESSLLLFIRFVSTSSALGHVRNLASDATWVLFESARRALASVLLQQQTTSSSAHRDGKDDARRPGWSS